MGKGEFYKTDLSCVKSCNELASTQEWDIIVALGLMHHLADGDVLRIRKMVMNRNKSGAILTIDPVILDGQNPIDRFKKSIKKQAVIVNIWITRLNEV